MTSADSSACAEASRLLNLPTCSLVVMAGLDPAIHVFGTRKVRENVDARHKAGHDGVGK
jgi:hypothetical protein